MTWRCGFCVRVWAVLSFSVGGLQQHKDRLISLQVTAQYSLRSQLFLPFSKFLPRTPHKTFIRSTFDTESWFLLLPHSVTTSSHLVSISTQNASRNSPINEPTQNPSITRTSKNTNPQTELYPFESSPKTLSPRSYHETKLC